MDWHRVWSGTREDVLGPIAGLIESVPRRLTVRLLLVPLVVAGLLLGLVFAGTVMRGVIGWLAGHDLTVTDGLGEALAVAVGWGLVGYFGVWAPFAFLGHYVTERNSWRSDVDRLRRERLANR